MYKIGLFNDSFPPSIDGVANAVVNYANIIDEKYGDAIVVTPMYPNVIDNYPYEVFRYHSAKVTKNMPYRIGNPFSPATIHTLCKKKFDLLHVHSPFVSSLLAHEVALFSEKKKLPTVLTYHTKFDIDIDRYISNKEFNTIAKKFVKKNISYADEVWTVSNGTIDSLRKIGYNGQVVVVPNGTDMKKGKSSKNRIAELDRIYRTKDQNLVFLYCGRLMWYKNIKIILDALKIIASSGIKFKTFFVGDGPDRPSIESYAKNIGISDYVIFTGAIYDRDTVKTYFSRANLLLFPSTYDTSGLVVKEAASCACPTALIKDSCAAEGILDGKTGILAEKEDCESFAKVVLEALRIPGKLEEIGKAAQENVYLSWEDAVSFAYKRYEYVIENFKRKKK